MALPIFQQRVRRTMPFSSGPSNSKTMILFFCAFSLAMMAFVEFFIRPRALSNIVLRSNQGTDRYKTQADSTTSPLRYCDLESPQDRNVLEDLIWIDPEDPHDASKTSRTRVSHPTSDDMKWLLKYGTERVTNDAERLKRNSRLQIDTQSPSQCRLKEWDASDFVRCIGPNRRLVFVGDSVTMQQAESLSYLLGVTNTWEHKDHWEHKKGQSRHSIDAKTSDGVLEIIARAVFHSDEEDGTPMKFNKEAWDIMVKGFGGWRDGDILVVNFGAHYMANLLDLRRDLEVLFYQVLAEIPKKHPTKNITVFWRDYAPAHFQAFPDGEYPPSHFVKRANETACVPHLTAPKTPSIVKHVVTKILEDCGEACIHIRRLNIWDLLRNAWDQHTEGSHCYSDEWCDCRHYTIPGPMDYANVLFYNQLCVNHAGENKDPIQVG